MSFDVKAEIAVVVENFGDEEAEIVLPGCVVVDVLTRQRSPAMLVGVTPKHVIKREEESRLNLWKLHAHGT